MLDKIIYTTNIADDLFETELTLNTADQGVLRIGSNKGTPNLPVGIFRGQVSHDLIKALDESISTNAYLNSESQELLVPDEIFREIKVFTQGNIDHTKLVGEQLVMPGPFAKAEKIIKKINNLLLDDPEVAVKFCHMTLPSQVSTNQEPLVLEVELQNIGSTTIRIEHPSKLGAGRNKIELVATRADIPLIDMGIQDQIFLTLSASSLVLSEDDKTDEDLLLTTNQSFSLTFSVLPEWPLGEYEISIDMILALLSEDGKKQVTVGIVSPKYKLVVE
ncbi:hypothetical protein L3081_22405 [Colwellia sp. MSW7]|uniref:DUF4469 domain-containing protein n=1 Tax=Colwellia maritima TaxID=2912588 RepID=A0ABS9X5X0_9GAMM|nr:hypothetical protein [Colwellia maritima]MCI2285628.1 hypothetical protein [Colwellia maritima]